MPDGLIGWIILGLLAGAISGWFVGTRSVQGCLPTIVVGVLGGIIGGWLSRELGFGQIEGFIGALVFAVIGSIVVRLVLRSIEGGRCPSRTVRVRGHVVANVPDTSTISGVGSRSVANAPIHELLRRLGLEWLARSSAREPLRRTGPRRAPHERRMLTDR